MKMNEMSRSEEKNYKLVDLIKFICAFLTSLDKGTQPFVVCDG